MWELYDALIAGIPKEAIVRQFLSGENWSAVETAASTGVAMTVSGTSRPPMHPESFQGEPLKKMAECLKSWNYSEASLGLAAVNAWYNSPHHAKSLDLITGETQMERDAFLTYQEEVAGKKVAVIGHFPYLETRFQPICSLSILERAPQAGDFPDSACEFLLPEQDYVFITGVTLVNKTLPRLLQLSERAKVVLVGPSVPLAPALFDFGVSALESFVVDSPEECAQSIRKCMGTSIFTHGKMVSLTKS